MGKSQQNIVNQKVRRHLTGPFDAPTALCFILGLALFYAWNLFAIYCGPVIPPPRYDYEFLPNVVTSATATLGFVSIAVALYRIKRFNIVGLVAAFVAGAFP